MMRHRNELWQYHPIGEELSGAGMYQIGVISPTSIPVWHSKFSWGWSLTFHWWRRGDRVSQSPCSGGNMKRYSSEVRGGVHTSRRCSGNNRLHLVTNYPQVAETNCSGDTDRVWNTTTHNIWVCYKAAEAGKKIRYIQGRSTKNLYTIIYILKRQNLPWTSNFNFSTELSPNCYNNCK